MKLTNAIIYRSMFPLTAAIQLVEAAMQTRAFAPCQPSQARSAGWVAPRGEENGPLIESVAGQWIAKLMIETKAVPGALVKRKLNERCAAIEEQTGRKPGKRERKELKEEVILDLLPVAFPKRSSIDVWIDREHELIVLNTSSQGRADEVASELVHAVEGLSLSLFNTVTAPSAAMAQWLAEDEPPAGFTIDRSTELQSADGSKKRVQYTNHPLDTDEIKAHIEAGLRPVKLAMTWDDRVSFVLTEGLTLRGITFLDGSSKSLGDEPPEDAFDADVVIATGEASGLIAALADALGGVQQMTLTDAAAADDMASESNFKAAVKREFAKIAGQDKADRSFNVTVNLGGGK